MGPKYKLCTYMYPLGLCCETIKAPAAAVSAVADIDGSLRPLFLARTLLGMPGLSMGIVYSSFHILFHCPHIIPQYNPHITPMGTLNLIFRLLGGFLKM